MMHSPPIRSSTEEPSGGGATDPVARPANAEIKEPQTGRTPARVTFGEELRRERELRQVDLREIAEATKINRRYLEALERNDFTDLPGGLFNRSFVRAYCQTIGIDDEVMVNAYLLEEQIQSAKADRFDPDLLRADPASRGMARRIPRSLQTAPANRSFWLWVLVLVVIAAACAAVIYLRIGLPGFLTSTGSTETLRESLLATSTILVRTNR